jgi:hypothetical protein
MGLESRSRTTTSLGGVVTIELDLNRGHNPANVLNLIGWTGELFKGEPVKNDC